MKKNNQTPNRSVRIFISSTFKDMMPEREHLMRVIFPELRRRCKKKFVDLTEVDLRWGILPEESEEGKVIEICLTEIDKSRPYFIGLLGNRYGWIPSPEEYERHARIIQEFPWVKDDIENNLSITEMEIQYGVLRNAQMAGRALFFMKNLPGMGEPRENADRLSRLKDEIAGQDNYPVQTYSSIEELGESVLEGLWKMIEAEFPDAEVPDEHEQEKLNQQCFSRSHISFYQDPGNWLDKLSESLESQGRAVVLGGAGEGKSALLANWIIQAPKDWNVVPYFCGSTASSTQLHQMVRYLAEELKRQFEISLEIPTQIEDSKSLLQAFLKAIPQEETVCLVLDGIGRLATSTLGWLPDIFPENVKMLLSTRETEQAEILRNRGFETLELQPLPPQTVRTIAEEYFLGYSKKLSPALLDQISKAPINQNPTVLRSLVNELRLFGSFEELPEQVTNYSRQKTESAFFQVYLEGLEQDFPKTSFRSDFILPALLLSAEGLTEDEIIKTSGLTQLNWSILYNALEFHLINKNGVLQVSNAFLAEAIREKYLDRPEEEKNIREKLVEYFEGELALFNLITPKAEMRRVARELPEHLLALEEIEKMKVALSFMPLFELIFENDLNRLSKYFSLIRPQENLGDLFLEAFTHIERSGMDPDRKVRIGGYVGDSLLLHDRPDHAIPVYYQALEIFNFWQGKQYPVVSILKNLAVCYDRLGKYQEAAGILEDLLPFENEEGMAEVLDLLSNHYSSFGEHERAILLAQDALAYSSNRFGEESLEAAIHHHNLGLVFGRKQAFSEARGHYLRAAEIAEKVAGKTSSLYQTVQSTLAVLSLNERNLEDAWERYWTVYQLRKAELGSSHPLTLKSMNGLGTCKSLMGSLGEAEGWLEMAWSGQKEVLGENHHDTLITLSNLADVYRQMGSFEKAEKMQREMFRAYTEVYGSLNEHSITAGLGLANLLQEQGKSEAAIEQYAALLPIVREFHGEMHQMPIYVKYKMAEIGVGIREATEEDLNAFLEWYLTKARNFMEEGDFPAAEEYFNKVLELSQRSESGVHQLYFVAVEDLASLYFRWEKHREAVSYCDKMIELAKDVLGQDSDVYFRFSILKAYNLFRDGDFEVALQIIQEIGEQQEAFFQKAEVFVRKLYQEMVTFYNRWGNALENYRANQEEVDAQVENWEARMKAILEEVNAENR